MNRQNIILITVVVVVLSAALSVGVVALMAGCYPKNCDPKTDPLKCQCPDGPCGPDPGIKDAGGGG